MVRLILLLAVALSLGAAARAQPIAHADLTELSGLAVSRRDPALLWGHNDTGSGPVLYRLGSGGEDFGRVPVPSAGATDWEDIAAFEDDAGPALLIADVGDNLALRTVLSLYAVRDPGRTGTSAPLLWRLDFRFADGSRDCEAVAVDTAAREILLVSKRDRPARVYRLPLPRAPVKEVLVAEAVGPVVGLAAPQWRDRVSAPLAGAYFHMPTALDIAADGATAVLVTPRRAYRYRRRNGEAWREALTRAPDGALSLPDLKQIEAAALSADGRLLHIGSEGTPGQVVQLSLP